jgi:hypothetical protein
MEEHWKMFSRVRSKTMSNDQFDVIRTAQEVLSREYNFPKLPETPTIDLELIESPLIEQNKILNKTLDVVTQHLEIAIQERDDARRESKRNFIITVISIAVAIISSGLAFIF